MKKNRLFEDDWKQANDEVKVAKMQLKNMQANIQELLNKIDSAEELDAWVQSYLTKADDYLDSVKKYVVFGQDEESTVLQPTEVAPEGEPVAGPANVPAQAKPLMPSISDYDPDAEEPAMDLTPDTEVEEPEGEEEPIEGPELPGEELPGEEEEDEFPEEGEELPGEGEELPGEGEELPGEGEEDEFPEEGEEDLPGEDGEEAIEEPEELDLDDEEFEMPSIGDFEVEDGEAVSEMPMPKPKPEDEFTFDDVEFFNQEEPKEEIEG